MHISKNIKENVRFYENIINLVTASDIQVDAKDKLKSDETFHLDSTDQCRIAWRPSVVELSALLLKENWRKFSNQEVLIKRAQYPALKGCFCYFNWI